MSDLPQGLKDEVTRLAAAPILLVACDYDGTMAPLAPTPHEAVTDARTLAVLDRLAAMESTHAAVVSGRARADLVARFGGTGRITLIGGHGAEMPMPTRDAPALPEPRAVEALAAEMSRIAGGFPGALVEVKPTGVAVHYRNVDPAEHGRIRGLVREAALRARAPMVREGVLVLEAGLVSTDKGRALRWLSEHVFAHAVLFVGDDHTDEDAFAVMRPVDLGVKIGDAKSAARMSVRDIGEVVGLLEAVASAREGWWKSRHLLPIDEHALLSDQRTCALVDGGGRVAWMCSPRFDSAPVFGQIVGGTGAGFFEVAPADGRPVVRRGYDGDTFLLRTELEGLTITDYLDCSAGRPFQRAGRTDLIRRMEGKGKIVVRFAPRVDFGRSATRLRFVNGGNGDDGLVLDGMMDPASLRAPGVAWTVQDDGAHQTAVATVDVPPEGLTFELRMGSTSLKPHLTSEPARREATRAFWAGWTRPLRLPGLHTELVKRSALVIKALCYGPTGAICAAGTASLPEQLGGVRNWDYRFCWVRDAAMSAAALVRLGSIGHAIKYLDWLGGILEELDGPEELRPLYTVRGADLGPEGEVSGLPGYGDSRPVRVGNGAAQQVQLDVFGVVADLIALLAEAGAPLSPEHWRMLDAMVRAVGLRWREPDHGIWEIRGPMRHHVHSKCMCWWTVVRAIHARELAGEPVKLEDHALANAIREEVLANGVLGTPALRAGSPAGEAYFTTAYGEPSVDAACLTVGLTGMVAPDDPRFAATIRAVERELVEGGTVLRYRCDDGLPGVEGGFHLCTGWLIESLWMAGRREEAREWLDRYAAQAGPLGLYAEERCGVSGRALGNYPQAYSHLALINACVRLSAGA